VEEGTKGYPTDALNLDHEGFGTICNEGEKKRREDAREEKKRNFTTSSEGRNFKAIARKGSRTLGGGGRLGEVKRRKVKHERLHGRHEPQRSRPREIYRGDEKIASNACGKTQTTDNNRLRPSHSFMAATCRSSRAEKN